MSVTPKLAQDVWKDIGENVSFLVFNLTRTNLATDQAAIAEFADRSQAIIRSMNIRANTANLKVAIGFSRSAWDYLFPNAARPKELETFTTLQSGDYQMPGTEGDIFLHIRANSEAVVYEVTRQFMLFLQPITTLIDETKGFRYFEGRAIIGFIDGTEAPNEFDAADYALIGAEDATYLNGSYAFAQKWQHDMPVWQHLSTETQEQAIGRHKFDDLELDDDEKLPNAHNIASKLEIDGEEQKIVRMNVPFSDNTRGETGTYFIGYARHWTVTKAMLTQMLSKADYLLSFSTITTGQLFFIPSRPTLAAIAEGELF